MQIDKIWICFHQQYCNDIVYCSIANMAARNCEFVEFAVINGPINKLVQKKTPASTPQKPTDWVVNLMFISCGKQRRCSVIYLTNKLVRAAGPVQHGTWRRPWMGTWGWGGGVCLLRDTVCFLGRWPGWMNRASRGKMLSCATWG